MAKVPIRFKKVLAAMGEEALVRARLCESSGSEHSPPPPEDDLSDLVNSFIERDAAAEEGAGDGETLSERRRKRSDRRQGSDCGSSESDFEAEQSLRSLLRVDGSEGGAAGKLRRRIGEEVELARRYGGGSGSSSPEFKRRLMARLRDAGYDAGLCKSKWEKTGRIPAGIYEYVDVNVAGNRYIVEVSLAGEFDIARPSGRYASLLERFPAVFVGKVEELKQVVRIMCMAIRVSMKSMDMHVPPWRRNGYMQAKWFGPYKRTINAIPARKATENEEFSGRRSMGFEALPGISYYCKDDFAGRVGGARVGLLAAALSNGLG